MPLGGTDLNLLHALRALLEEVNVTHAGRRLNMGQPAMSGALAKLRRQFGDELLVRSGRDYELTPLAQELLPVVQRAQRQLSDALLIGDRFAPETSRRVFRFVLSDYALAVLYEPLMRRIGARAPQLTCEFDSIGTNARESDREILDHDVLIGPMGYGFPGVEELFFKDRMVCLADKHNARLVDGGLTLAALSELPHAIATFGRNNLTPADRILGELGVTRRVQVAVTGWLALPYVIEGTDMVAVVPRRLADRFCPPDGPIAVVEPPFGAVDLVEGFWCQEAKLAEPAHQWLVCILREVAAELAED